MLKVTKTSETAMSGADEVQYYNLLPPPIVPGSHDLASSRCGGGVLKEPRRPPRTIDNNVDSYLVDHSYYNLPTKSANSPAPPRLPKRKPNTTSTLVRGDSCRSRVDSAPNTNLAPASESNCKCKSGRKTYLFNHPKSTTLEEISSYDHLYLT